MADQKLQQCLGTNWSHRKLLSTERQTPNIILKKEISEIIQQLFLPLETSAEFWFYRISCNICPASKCKPFYQQYLVVTAWVISTYSKWPETPPSLEYESKVLIHALLLGQKKQKIRAAMKARYLMTSSENNPHSSCVKLGAIVKKFKH